MKIDEALKYLKKRIKCYQAADEICSNTDCKECEFFTNSKDQFKALNALIKAYEYEQRGWHPMKDGYPDEYGEYFITWKTPLSPKPLVASAEYAWIGEIDCDTGEEIGDWICPDYINYYPDVKVTAWKNFPKPYEEE